MTKKTKTVKTKTARNLPAKPLNAKTARGIKGGVNISNFPHTTLTGDEGSGASGPQKP